MVKSSPQRGTLWSGHISASVRPLGHDPHCAFLVMTGSHNDSFRLPLQDTITAWLDTLLLWGYRRVRTNAVVPAADATLRAVGFRVVQELSVLSVSHWTPAHLTTPATTTDQKHDRDLRKALRWRRLRPTIQRNILDIDAQAFGPHWHLDSESLTDAIGATSHAQVFVAQHDNVCQGFAVVGATGGTGYLQRLAVHHQYRHTGIGTALVQRALHWTQKHGCTHTVVNTETTNHGAQALYEKMGFVLLPNRLTVLAKELQ